MSKKHVGEETQLTLPHCCSSLKEVRTGTQTGQEPGTRMQRPWRDAAYLLPMDCINASHWANPPTPCLQGPAQTVDTVGWRTLLLSKLVSFPKFLIQGKNLSDLGLVAKGQTVVVIIEMLNRD